MRRLPGAAGRHDFARHRCRQDRRAQPVGDDGGQRARPIRSRPRRAAPCRRARKPRRPACAPRCRAAAGTARSRADRQRHRLGRRRHRAGPDQEQLLACSSGRNDRPWIALPPYSTARSIRPFMMSSRQRAAVVLVQVEQDAGMPRAHRAQQRQRQRRRRGAGRQPDRHRRPTAPRPAASMSTLRLLALAQDELGMAVQHLAGLGRRHAALGAHQQLLAHLAFERRELLAQRRLRDVQHLGGLRQAADVDDLHEVLQAPEVHAVPAWPDVQSCRIHKRSPIKADRTRLGLAARRGPTVTPSPSSPRRPVTSIPHRRAASGASSPRPAPRRPTAPTSCAARASRSSTSSSASPTSTRRRTSAQAAAAAMDKGATRYTLMAGTVELRQAIAAKLERENGLSYGLHEIIVDQRRQERDLQRASRSRSSRATRSSSPRRTGFPTRTWCWPATATRSSSPARRATASSSRRRSSRPRSRRGRAGC